MLESFTDEEIDEDIGRAIDDQKEVVDDEQKLKHECSPAAVTEIRLHNG